MFTVDEILRHHYPRLAARPLVAPPLRSLLRRLLREERFSRFTEQYPHLEGMDFVEQVLTSFRCSYILN